MVGTWAENCHSIRRQKDTGSQQISIAWSIIECLKNGRGNKEGSKGVAGIFLVCHKQGEEGTFQLFILVHSNCWRDPGSWELIDEPEGFEKTVSCEPSQYMRKKLLREEFLIPGNFDRQASSVNSLATIWWCHLKELNCLCPKPSFPLPFPR